MRRDDFTVVNDRGGDLACSLWRDEGHGGGAGTPGGAGASPSSGGFRPFAKFRKTRDDARRRFCVVYVHDVGGSRLGALSCLGVALDAGAAGYFAFDSTGCGRSSGRHVSFGHLERWDVASVCQELVRKRGFTDVVLWGRGAGAVAALLYARYASLPPPKRREAKDASWEFGDYFGGASPDDGGAYPEKEAVSVDVFDVPARGGISTCPDFENDGRARARAANAFLDGVEVSQLTVMWVMSKPPLYVSKVRRGSAAEGAGLRVGDAIAGVGTSMRLPHTSEEFRDIVLKLAARERPDLLLHVFRDSDPAKRQAAAFPQPLPTPSGIILDCVVDSPGVVVDALRAHAAEREPVLVTLLEPVLASALDVLYHSVEKRANFDPRSIKGTEVASRIKDVPALFAVNDFSDLDRGIPKLSSLTTNVYDAYASRNKSLVRYNSPLRLALRGTLDAMSSKFLNKAFVFLQKLEGFEPVPTFMPPPAPRDVGAYDLGCGDDAPVSMPRWVVTTRPWSQTEAEKTIDDYESAQIVIDKAA